jgi:hypothetical protein
MSYPNDQRSYLRQGSDQCRPDIQPTTLCTPLPPAVRHGAPAAVNLAIGLHGAASSRVGFAPYTRTRLRLAGLQTLRCTLRGHTEASCGPGADS